MAETAAVGWVVSPIIKILVDKACSYIENQYNWHKDIQRKLKKLKEDLTNIQNIAAAAEGQQSLNAEQARVLCLLKDAVYEADDLLDEDEYRRLEAQAMEVGGMVSPGVSSFLKFLKRLIRQDELPRKLKEILNKLNSVKEDAKTFNVQVVGSKIISAIEQGVIKRDRDTSSFPTSEILGRDMEKDKLINLLREIADESTSKYPNIPIISIVGSGGIGKTTLAQFVYNDRRIKGQFNLRMWVCVSDNFDEKTLTKKILECASGSNEKHEGINSLDILKGKLKMELESKKFLLVLDDVWIDEKRGQIEDEEIWKKILAPMKDSIRGSKILMTTRENRVATILGTTRFFPLHGLEDKENWSILKMNAFGNNIPNNHQKLEKIGLKTIKKLKGSPLAACVVGAMLRDTLDPEKLLQNLQMESLDGVMSVLRLSYNNLEEHLKPCFAYCSIFPKDSEFRPEKLVPLWIAQGYVHCPRGDGRSLIDIGMDHFNQLWSRSFFKKSEQTSSECYIMHDCMHDLAQTVASDECFGIDGGKQWEIPQAIRHLGVHIRSDKELKDVVLGLKKMNNIKNLRSLIFFGSTYLNHIGHQLLLDMLKELRSVRVLDLYGLHLENFQGELNHLRHLRYLHLGYRSLRNLPESVYRLYHLTRLDVRCLQVNVEKKKKNGGVGALQGVGMKVVFPEQLRINNLQYCSSREEALEADLGSKQCLNCLELEWGSSGRIIGHDADAEVAEALKPHPNLKQLIIKGFRGINCPSWLHRAFLQSLRLTECWDLQGLPPLNHLTLLKTLVVERCPKLTSFPRFPSSLAEIDIQDTGLISHLRLTPPSSSPERFELNTSHIALLHKDHLQAIEWLCISNCEEPMPARWLLELVTLRTLVIERCRDWLTPEEEKNGSGDLPSSLESLEIKHCHLTDMGLFRRLQGGLTSLSKLRILFCTGLTSLPSAEVLQSLTALQVLGIWRCEDLRSLGGLDAHAGLKQLTIHKCPRLLTSNEDGGGALPLSLKVLEINDCPVTDRWLSRCLQGSLTSLSELRILFCTGLTSLPSAEVLQSLTALQLLRIWRCEDLTSLGGLHALAALKKLEIRECPALLTSEKDGCSVLPSSLESLEIHDCPVTDRWLSRGLQGALTSLSELGIKRCTRLTSLPSAEVLQHLTALKDLRITGCEDLTSFGGLQALATLKRLEITECAGLLMSEEDGCCVLPSSLKSLEIKHCPVTDMGLSRCLQGSLTSLYQLDIWWCTGLKSLPSVEVLQSLTALQMLSIEKSTELTSLGGLHSLAALKYLKVEDCPKVKSLPEGAMPASIVRLILCGCDPALQQQIRDKKGPDWEKVAHIPRVRI